MSGYHYTQWLDIATAGILDPHERESARQELLDHMEDRAEDRMAKGVSRTSAMDAACSAMGDPHEVAALLRRAHQPILTRLLQLTKKVAILLAIVTVWQVVLTSDFTRNLWIQLTDPPHEYPSAADLPFQTDPLPESVTWRMIAQPENTLRAGDYWVSVKRLSISHRPLNDSPNYSVHLELEFRPVWFWQEDALPEYSFRLRSEGDWELVGDQALAPGEDQELLVNVGGGEVTLWGLFNHRPTALEVEYYGSQNRFTLPIDLSGGVVYER